MSDLQQATAYLNMNRPQEAVTYARKAVASDPDFAGTRAILLEALIHSQRDAEALKEGRAALTVAPDDPVLHKLTGIAAYQQGLYKEARDHLQRSLKLWPEDPGAHAVLGQTFAELRKGAQAIEHATKAASLAPEDAFAHRAVGDVYLKLKDWENAKAAYRRSLELDPGDTYTHTNLGYALEESGDRDAALEHTVTAARLDPTNRVATNNVVGLGRAAIAGGGLFIYIMIWVGSLGTREANLRFLVPIALALAITGWMILRKMRERKLPPVVRDALRTQRRLDGPLPTPAWILLTVAGYIALGGVAGRVVDGEPNSLRTETVNLAIGAALVTSAAYFIRRRMRQRNLADSVRGNFPFWALLASAATLITAWLFVQTFMPDPSVDSRGDAVTGFLGAIPIAAVLGYIALGKRPALRGRG
jgi:tetratricopeptide (TPR) repeat protein